MKDIKNYAIGFLSATCLFLIMGHSNPNLNANFDKLEVDELFVKKITLTTDTDDTEENIKSLNNLNATLDKKNGLVFEDNSYVEDSKMQVHSWGFDYEFGGRRYSLTIDNSEMEGFTGWFNPNAYTDKDDKWVQTFSLGHEWDTDSGGDLSLYGLNDKRVVRLGNREGFGMMSLFNKFGDPNVNVLPTIITAY